MTCLLNRFRYGRLVEEEYVPASNTCYMSEPSTCLPMVVSLFPLPTITQYAFGIYATAREEIGGMDPTISHQFHCTQMGDMSQLGITMPYFGYGMSGQVSWQRNARLEVVPVSANLT